MALNNDDLLKMIRKVLSESANTNQQHQPWHELLGTQGSTPNRAIQSVDVIHGFVGSWAASFGIYDERYVSPPEAIGGTEGFPPPSLMGSRIGVAGVPEVNFVPYAYGTNQGPSLVGHPVSFEVIGPTRKTATLDALWKVVDGHTLEMETPDGVDVTEYYSDRIVPGILGPKFLYINEPGGPLVSFHDDGATAQDNYQAGQHRTTSIGYVENEDRKKSARFELFRIERVDGTRVHLHNGKSLLDYFSPEADGARIAGLTVIQPKVAPLLEMPGSDGLVYAVTPPTTAATSDHWPTLKSWVDGGGDKNNYQRYNRIPIPRPGVFDSATGGSATRRSFKAQLPEPGYADSAISQEKGAILFVEVEGDRPRVGDIVNIRQSGSENQDGSGAPHDSVLGYFTVISVDTSVPDKYSFQVAMPPQVDPATGVVFHPDTMESRASRPITVSGAIHQSISYATVASPSNIDKGDLDLIDAVRLTNIIDPREVGRSVKVKHGVNERGFTAARADRAIFDTVEGNDPGSLMDLGFRMVLFPTKKVQVGGAFASTFDIPDWDNPITSREVTLDSSITDEDQYIDVDYANGLVRFSHKPVDFVGPFWAAFVPYSMDQTGAGFQVTGGEIHLDTAQLRDSVYRTGADDPQRDALSQKDYLQILDDQQVTQGGNLVAVLDGWEDGKLWSDPRSALFPQTGWLSVVRSPSGKTHTEVTTGRNVSVRYSGWTVEEIPEDELLTNINYHHQGLYRSGSSPRYRITFHNTWLPDSSTGAPTVLNLDAKHYVVRLNDPGLDIRLDGGQGSNIRVNTLRFKYADLTYNKDGSVTVLPTAVAGPAEELRAFFPLGEPNEFARFYISPETHRWTVSGNLNSSRKERSLRSPTARNEVGLEISRGRLFSNFSMTQNLQWTRVAAWADSISLENGIFKLMVPNAGLSDGSGGVDESHSLPKTSGAAGYLCANIEGSLIASAQVPAQNFTANERLVVNLKKYDDAETRQSLREGPSNPVHWDAISLGLGWGPSTAVELKHRTDVDQFAYVDERLYMAGRQISVMPSRPYVGTTKLAVAFPYEPTKPKFVGITIRSADPNHASNWVSFTQMLSIGTYNTVKDLADELNKGLNDPTHENYVGHLLDAAGFKPGAAVSNQLLVEGNGERQITWISSLGPAPDPRAQNLGIDPLNGLALICSGTGYGHEGADGEPFYNVVVELVDVADPEFSLLRDLSGEFANTISNPSCGMFYGDSAKSNTKPDTVPAADWLAWGRLFGATGNREVGFDANGYDPLGRVVGGFKIVDIEENDSNVRYVLRLPTGSDLSNGVQASSGINHVAGQPDGKVKNVGKSRLGNWSWSGDATLDRIDISDPSSSGFFGAWVTFGTQEYSEDSILTSMTPYKNSISDPAPIQFRSALLRGTLVGLPPGNRPQDYTRGDLVRMRIETQSSGGVYAHLEGRVLHQDGTDLDVVVTRPEQYTHESRELYGFAWWSHPSLAGPYSKASRSVETVQGVQIAPSPTSTGLGAFSHVLTGRLGNTFDQNVTHDGHGLSTPRNQWRRSDAFTMIGGGRVSIFSPYGANESSGVTFFTPGIHPNLGVKEFPLVGATHLESGVFTTSLRISPSGSTTPRDSIGLFGQNAPTSGTTGNYSDEIDVGGVGGLRVSGDANVWLKNFRPLSSNNKGAFVRMVLGTELNGHTLSLLGQVTPAATEAGSGHAPSGWTRGGVGEVLHEATIHLGLTVADLRAICDYEGTNYWPFSNTSGAFNDLFSGGKTSGSRLLEATERVDSTLPVPVASLVGCYISLHSPGTAADQGNAGIWKIVGVPLIQRSAARPDVQKYPDPGEVYSNVNPYGPWGQKHYPFTLDSSNPQSDYGHVPASAQIAMIEIRVERQGSLPHVFVDGAGGDPSDTHFVPELEPEHGQVFSWSIYKDAAGSQQIWVADVVDPGGSPTGSPASLRGLTLNPMRAAGKRDLAIQIHPIVLDQVGSPKRLVTPDYGDPVVSNDPNGWRGDGEAFNRDSDYDFNGRLLGIHDSLDGRGKHTSRAVFVLRSGGFVSQALEQLKAARMEIFSSEAEQLETIESGTQGHFEVDESGRLNFVGMARRLGPGVLMDGGLGLVQATAFRATPRPVETENIGAMTVFGRGAFPYTNYLSDVADRGRELPSVLNRAEVYDDLSIAGPSGRLVFESPWAAEGIAKNMEPTILAASTYPGPNSFIRSRLSSGAADMKEAGLYIPDTIFPKASSGIRFKTPGTVVYNRAFRTVDSQGSRSIKSAMFGNIKLGGIPGMEIPVSGEALLLPQGPPDLRADTASHVGVNFATTGPVPTLTPLDVPIVEWINRFGETPNQFGINPRSIFPTISAAEKKAGYHPHKASPGSIYTGYRDSNSRRGPAFYSSTLKGDHFLRSQLRVLDGMIMEDVTNGTFYTIGDVGRWRRFSAITNKLGCPGDGDRSAVHGSLITTTYNADTNTDPEIIYDIGQHTDPLSNPLVEEKNGFGDRVDDSYVRRPLAGHRMRITPNVEFVPVLGPRGVTGSLLPPWAIDSKTGFPRQKYEGADAFFFDPHYSFKEAGAEYGSGDVGKLLYLCGTNNYKYTGWWLIIDVVNYYSVALESIFKVAVLRKYRGRGYGDIPGEASTNDGAFPLEAHTPDLQAVADALTNDRSNAGPFDGTGVVGDFVVSIRRADGTASKRVIPSAELAACTDVNMAIAKLMGDPRSNGIEIVNELGCNSTGAPQPIISWYQPNQSNTLKVKLVRAGLTDEDWQKLSFGPLHSLQVIWNTRTDGAHANPEPYQQVGFVDVVGHNTTIRGGWGDRNNWESIKSHYDTALLSNPAKGIRWVFSSPLTEENVSSYMHLERTRVYRFGKALPSQDDGTPLASPATLSTTWTSGHVREVDATSPSTFRENLGIEVFRINRCPSTGNIILGGDCEVYNTSLSKDRTGALDWDGVGRPVMYSPLSVWGNWQDTVTNELPDTGALNYPVVYHLQPIGREKIVTVSPTMARSNTVMARGLGDEGGASIGELGVGPMVATSPLLPMSPGRSFSLSEPWQLIGRADVQRTSMAEPTADGGGFLPFDSRVEINNANNPNPNMDELYNPSLNPVPTSNYAWSPAGEWWQLFQPAWATHGPDMSHAPPTLRMDLTDYFTQSMGPGGLNSPHPDRAPKGMRLNRIWVNFGLWGNNPGHTRLYDETPGYRVSSDWQDTAQAFYMAFNLVLEIPGSQAVVLSKHGNSTHSGTSGFPFGDRAPTAAASHSDNSVDKYPGGTIVVPLYVNREAGDMMPNVMERFVSVGPRPSYNDVNAPNSTPEQDWSVGHYEFGFGASDNVTHNDTANWHDIELLESNAYNPVLWGGIDTAPSTEGGPFVTPPDALVQATPFPRSSRVSGGLRSAFTSGIVPDGVVFAKPNAWSLSAAAQTGIVVAHTATLPGPRSAKAGSYIAKAEEGPTSAPHAFTMALTPVGDAFYTPKDEFGNLAPSNSTSNPDLGDEAFGSQARSLNMLDPSNNRQFARGRKFKVGNWLDEILSAYGFAAESGSMLPPGARVFLECACGPGPAGAVTPPNWDEKIAAGSWIGSVKLSFDVETADGTAWSSNVNILGDEEG